MHLKKIDSKVIVGFWKKALKNAKEYFEIDEHVHLTDEESDDNSDFDNDLWFDLLLIFFIFLNIYWYDLNNLTKLSDHLIISCYNNIKK